MINLRSKWLKPYGGLSPEGVLNDAIVVYGKRPYEQKSYDTDFGKGQGVYISAYKHILVLNLWFVFLRFEWIWKGKVPEDADA